MTSLAPYDVRNAISYILLIICCRALVLEVRDVLSRNNKTDFHHDIDSCPYRVTSTGGREEEIKRKSISRIACGTKYASIISRAEY